MESVSKTIQWHGGDLELPGYLTGVGIVKLGLLKENLQLRIRMLERERQDYVNFLK